MKEKLRLKWFILMLLFIGISFLTVNCSQQTGETIAIVNETEITTQDFKYALNNLPDKYKVLAKTYKGKRKILDNLIKKELLAKEARQREYDKDPQVKARIKTETSEAKDKLNAQIAELKVHLSMIDKAVTDNIMLNELNKRLKQSDNSGIKISQEEIEEYYQDYSRKLKIINPAVKVPGLDEVEEQIKAILVEKDLIKKLQKQSEVEVKEERFREIYDTQVADDIVIEDKK